MADVKNRKERIVYNSNKTQIIRVKILNFKANNDFI